MKAPGGQQAAGLLYSVAAYVLWGVLPVYFVALAPTGAIEIVSWRVLFAVAFCVLLITAVRGWPRLVGLLRDRRAMGWLALAAVLVGVNWLVFVYSTTIGEVVESALGYFINPLVSILIGVVFLRDRLRVLQWVAVAIAAVAVVVLVVLHGTFPWIAISLALSFGVYGFVKNRVGGRVDAVSGLAIETAYLTPLALIGIGWIVASGQLTFGRLDWWHTLLLIGLGVATAIPLLLFAAGARRLSLSYVGLTQFFAPILQFLVGVLVLREPMPPERWIGFGIVWLALAVLIVDMVLAIVRHRRTGPLTGADVT